MFGSSEKGAPPGASPGGGLLLYRRPTGFPGDRGRAAEDHKIGIHADDFYAARCIDALGARPLNGVVRASLVHYNSPEDVDRLFAGLEQSSLALWPKNNSKQPNGASKEEMHHEEVTRSHGGSVCRPHMERPGARVGRIPAGRHGVHLCIRSISATPNGELQGYDVDVAKACRREHLGADHGVRVPEVGRHDPGPLGQQVRSHHRLHVDHRRAPARRSTSPIPTASPVGQFMVGKGQEGSIFFDSDGSVKPRPASRASRSACSGRRPTTTGSQARAAGTPKSIRYDSTEALYLDLVNGRPLMPS